MLERIWSAPSESLARMVCIAREKVLPEIGDSKRKAVKRKKLIVKQNQQHHKQGPLIKI